MPPGRFETSPRPPPWPRARSSPLGPVSPETPAFLEASRHPQSGHFPSRRAFARLTRFLSRLSSRLQSAPQKIRLKLASLRPQRTQRRPRSFDFIGVLRPGAVGAPVADRKPSRPYRGSRKAASVSTVLAVSAVFAPVYFRPLFKYLQARTDLNLSNGGFCGQKLSLRRFGPCARARKNPACACRPAGRALR